MKSIATLPLTEQQHYTFCTECLHWFDMRSLKQVFHHLHMPKSVPVEPQWSYAVRVGEAPVYRNTNVLTNPTLQRKIRASTLRMRKLVLKQQRSHHNYKPE
ncbi:MAG TPA: hypothetical protein VHK91_11870 [Flavisolibacter sp.]|nr:hypothetical protein [Flavisolibacter sp.]